MTREPQHTYVVTPFLVARVLTHDGTELGVTAHPDERRHDLEPWPVFTPWPVVIDPTAPRRLDVTRYPWPEHEQAGPLPAAVRVRIWGEERP